MGTMEEVEQWKEKVAHWWRLGVGYLLGVPPIQLYSASAVLVFTTLLFLSSECSVRLFRRAKSNTIVLTGLSGSGKTTLFCQKGKIKPVHIVDVPEHSRLRPRVDEYEAQAAGIVFVVDALDFLTKLSCCFRGSVLRKKIPLLILCNKTDKVTAHTKEFIRRQREKEMHGFNNKLRASRSAVSEADIANEFTLGLPGEPFSFTQCSNKVTTADASGLTGDLSQKSLSENM